MMRSIVSLVQQGNIMAKLPRVCALSAAWGNIAQRRDRLPRLHVRCAPQESTASIHACPARYAQKERTVTWTSSTAARRVNPALELFLLLTARSALRATPTSIFSRESAPHAPHAFSAKKRQIVEVRQLAAAQHAAWADLMT